MIRAKYNYSDQKMDMRIMWSAYLHDFGAVSWGSLLNRGESLRILLYIRCLVYEKHFDMISFNIDDEMVKRDIEMCFHAYLSVKRSDSWDLESLWELAQTLRYDLEPIGLICNEKVKSGFSQVLQLWDANMLFLNLPWLWNISLLEFESSWKALPAPAI